MAQAVAVAILAQDRECLCSSAFVVRCKCILGVMTQWEATIQMDIGAKALVVAGSGHGRLLIRPLNLRRTSGPSGSAEIAPQ